MTVSCEIAEWLARIRQALRGRYLRMIEDELTRARGQLEVLRAENRALVNSLLGTAGVPPIETPRPLPSVPTVRRRSWPQIAAAREIEAARTEQKRERERERERNSPAHDS